MKHLEVPYTAAVFQVPTSTWHHNVHSLPMVSQHSFLFFQFVSSWLEDDVHSQERKTAMKIWPAEKSSVRFWLLCSGRVTMRRRKREGPVALLWLFLSMRSNVTLFPFTKRSDLKLSPAECKHSFSSSFSVTWTCQTTRCSSSKHFHITLDFF